MASSGLLEASVGEGQTTAENCNHLFRQHQLLLLHYVTDISLQVVGLQGQVVYVQLKFNETF